jgi:hypothetical protein
MKSTQDHTFINFNLNYHVPFLHINAAKLATNHIVVLVRRAYCAEYLRKKTKGS